MFGIKISTQKPITVGVESKLKPPDYGMVTMSCPWVLCIIRWLAMSSVLTAAQSTISPEGKQVHIQ